MKNTVQVSGLGAICANGQSPEAIFDSCLKGESTVNDQGLSVIPPEIFAQLRTKTPKSLNESKCTILSFHSLQQAYKNSGWSEQQLQTAGFIFATTTGKIDLWEKVLNSYDSPTLSTEAFRKAMAHQPLGAPLLELAEHFQIKGPFAQISSSCSASLQAIAMGMKWIESGKIERCIVGTSEIHNDLTRVGFNSLRLLSKNVSTPFDKNRVGINLGEGSAFLFLEKRNDKSSWGFITGAGLTSDAFHPTSPHPEGRGSFLAMQKAVEMAGLRTEDIDWVYAHGTGSPANDLAESQAVKSMFSHQPVVTSTKSLHGHTLGACGGIESAIGLVAMKNSVIMQNSYLTVVDPQIHLNLPTIPVKKSFKHFLKNSLGFGGINVSVVFSKDRP